MTNYNDLLNKEITCACGRTHFVPIKDVDFDFTEEKLSKICKEFIPGKNILVVGDKHTHEQINQKIFDTLKANEFNAAMLEFDEKKLIPDEKAIGTILMSTDREIDGIVSVGSGTINDLNRLVGDRMKIPVITIATAPSMDGYASSGSSLMFKGVKKTIKGSTVTAIYGDIEVIKNCPYDLIQAGFGDIIGKKTSLADWVLSKHITGEYWCDKTVKLVEESTDICIREAEKIAQRDTEAIGHLIDALTLSGICMSLVDDTRPASGSEHLVSHYLVMKAVEKGELPPSHGRTVAIGTLISTLLYKFLFETKEFTELENSEKIKEDLMKYLPKEEKVKTWLTTLDLSYHPSDYGMTPELLREIVLKAGFIRDRYTVFRLLDSLKLLDRAADYLINYFYK
ncbi:sn-glycerol-1-phosphate dehydrogenase [Irregularibacter muris]|uniref:Sn-glycerol-1-phosphate dehydrogenase n=1 Tax=Irregularibacter muris TaxID=1796619 RepID=A0AAE3HDU0_9FIRM|nr:sn-glycerol-1-phosphate dehydrogenase [Irregularibacter muris]MCR1897562.1 sn-glycerol-1-phosphate dehydrogenase [Irregularibacter muris]